MLKRLWFYVLRHRRVWVWKVQAKDSSNRTDENPGFSFPIFSAKVKPLLARQTATEGGQSTVINKGRNQKKWKEALISFTTQLGTPQTG